MKIGDLLAMTKTESLEEIAKKYLTIGKTAARQALKNAGCYCKRGTRGWYHDNLHQVAELSIYDFAPARKTRSKPNDTNENAIKALIANADLQISAEMKEKVANKAPLPTNSKEKSCKESAYDELDAIDLILFHEELERDLKTYKGFYWDADIIEFIGSVKEEYQSGLMNEIVRSVLLRKGFL